jgi:hypothetical protein
LVYWSEKLAEFPHGRAEKFWPSFPPVAVFTMLFPAGDLLFEILKFGFLRHIRVVQGMGFPK